MTSEEYNRYVDLLYTYPQQATDETAKKMLISRVLFQALRALKNEHVEAVKTAEDAVQNSLNDVFN